MSEWQRRGDVHDSPAEETPGEQQQPSVQAGRQLLQRDSCCRETASSRETESSRETAAVSVSDAETG